MPLSISKILLLVLLPAALFALVGGLLGAGLGMLAPDYYRSVLAGGQAPGFQPVQAGIGLGVTQGFVGGAVLGAILLAVVIGRQLALEAPQSKPAPTTRASVWAWRAGSAAVVLLLLGFCSGAAFLIGGIVGQQHLYARWSHREIRQIEAELTDNRFPQIRVEAGPAGTAYLRGTVASADAKKQLQSRLERAVGRERAGTLIYGVDIAPPPSAKQPQSGDRP